MVKLILLLEWIALGERYLILKQSSTRCLERVHLLKGFSCRVQQTQLALQKHCQPAPSPPALPAPAGSALPNSFCLSFKTLLLIHLLSVAFPNRALSLSRVLGWVTQPRTRGWTKTSLHLLPARKRPENAMAVPIPTAGAQWAGQSQEWQYCQMLAVMAGTFLVLWHEAQCPPSILLSCHPQSKWVTCWPLKMTFTKGVGFRHAPWQNQLGPLLWTAQEESVEARVCWTPMERPGQLLLLQPLHGAHSVLKWPSAWLSCYLTDTFRRSYKSWSNSVHQYGPVWWHLKRNKKNPPMF